MSEITQRKQKQITKRKIVEIEDLEKNRLSFTFDQKLGEIRAFAVNENNVVIKNNNNKQNNLNLYNNHQNTIDVQLNNGQEFFQQKFQLEVESLNEELTQKQLWKQLQQIQKLQQEENREILRKSQQLNNLQEVVQNEANQRQEKNDVINIDINSQFSNYSQQIAICKKNDEISQFLSYSSILKMKLKRIQIVYNQEQDKNSIIYGNFGLKGGSVVDHLSEDKKYMFYYKTKTYFIPFLKFVLGIVTISYSDGFKYDKYWSTVAMGGWNLIQEGLNDAGRDIIEWLRLPNQSRDYNILQRMTTDVRKRVWKNRLIYLSKFIPIQLILMGLQIFICYCVIETYIETPQISSKFELLIIFFVSLLCFVESFPQTMIRMVKCITFHSENNIQCHKFQYVYKPVFQITLCLCLIILFVIMGTSEEQSAFFPTLAIYTISSDINQLKDNQGVLLTKQMKEIGSGLILGLSAEQRIHQVAILQDTISFNKYLSAFQVITSLLLILPVRYQDDASSRMEMLIFISLLLIDAIVNYCDSYYYRVVYKKENSGFVKYKQSLLDFMRKKEQQMQQAKK